jgi:hypothetical protein
MLSSPSSESIFGLLSAPFVEAVTVFVGLTTLFGGAVRYGAVLAGRSERAVERATGTGFFFGAGIATVLIFLEIIT